MIMIVRMKLIQLTIDVRTLRVNYKREYKSNRLDYGERLILT